jgi:predicted nucleic acid-binding protein
MTFPPLVLQGVLSNGAFVLDASLTGAWLFTTRANQYTSDVLFKIHHIPAVVPGNWTLHLTSICRSGEQQGLKGSRDIDLFLIRLPTLKILIEEDTAARAFNEILNVSRWLNISIDDAAYVELALRYSLPLATIDPSLARAAATAGVSLFAP